MDEGRSYEVLPGSHGRKVLVRARGSEVLRIPRINRGTAFTEQQRIDLGLVGLLPSGVTTFDVQLRRAYQQFQGASTNLDKFTYLQALRDRNTVLFYRLLADHLPEMMPIVYTPTIGEAIQNFSSTYHQRLHGVFLSIDRPDAMEASLLAFGRKPEDVDLVIVTDSEGILGIGDQGVGGIQICLGKKSLYTAAAGLDPNRAIPVVLDVGTDNLALLNDEVYLGERHSRVRGERYDAFIDLFVETVTRTFSHAMIHWEDFGASNAHRILNRYRDQICTFNDDVQGTAAVVGAAALAAVGAKDERMIDQRVVIFGAGTAGIGIADLMVDLMVAEGLDREECRSRFWCLSSQGLITTDTARIRDFQQPYARPAGEVAGWEVANRGKIGLLEVVRAVAPTILVGTSGQGGAFNQRVIGEMASHVDRPVIMPLSNPTVLAEALPGDVLAWTGGRALMATGSPFPPVRLGDVTYTIAQANNALVFPGLGLGVAVSRATRVSDGMITAAAQALASIPRLNTPGASLLPSVERLRWVSATVAVAVAHAAVEEGLAGSALPDPIQQVYDAMWLPDYPELIL
jgi:malate dehydrogenase (oxaloacetate-decarboxylating)